MGSARLQHGGVKNTGEFCRDAEVLSLFAAIINKLREKVQKEVPRIFEAVFECTLTMITKNFEVGILPQPRGPGSPSLGKQSSWQ